MFLVAFPAVYRSITGWLERYFSFLTAVCASCFMHLSWTAWSETAASSTAEAATSVVAHIYFSLVLIQFFSARAAIANFRMTLSILIVTLSPTFVPGTKITKPWIRAIPSPSLAMPSIVTSWTAPAETGALLSCSVNNSFPSVYLINQPKRSTHRRDIPGVY